MNEQSGALDLPLRQCGAALALHLGGDGFQKSIERLEVGGHCLMSWNIAGSGAGSAYCARKLFEGAML